MDLMHILYKEEWVTEKADISMTLKQGNHTILLVKMHQKEFYRLEQKWLDCGLCRLIIEKISFPVEVLEGMFILDL